MNFDVCKREIHRLAELSLDEEIVIEGFKIDEDDYVAGFEQGFMTAQLLFTDRYNQWKRGIYNEA